MDRSKTQSLPQVTFFFRHINDLNFSMPLILFATKPRIIFYEKINLSDRRIEKLIEKGIAIEKIHSPAINLIYLISDIASAIIKKIGLHKLASSVSKKINIIGSIFLNRNLLKIAQKDNLFLHNIFAFDHTLTFKSKQLIQIIRNNAPKGKNPSVISLPHGANIFNGKFLSSSDYKPPLEADFSIFDCVICNDPQHFHSIKGSKILIESLFHTKYWFKKMNQFLVNDFDTSIDHDQSINVLLVLSKTGGHSNVHLSEIERCIRIINNFKNIALRIKPHPRGLREANNYVSKFKNIAIAYGDVQPYIYDADFIINIQSNVVLDAFLANKQTIFPSFTTSNDLLQDIKDNLNIASSPDEFYRIMEQISLGGQLKLPKYNFIDWDKGLEKWIKFFSSL